MLMLTRSKGESIRIGDDISIKILKICRNGEVLIGIDAPREIAVHREEVYERIQKETEAQCQGE